MYKLFLCSTNSKDSTGWILWADVYENSKASLICVMQTHEFSFHEQFRGYWNNLTIFLFLFISFSVFSLLLHSTLDFGLVDVGFF